MVRGLRLAHRVADRVVTSTPDGFRLPSQKLDVIGQGVDTELFVPPPGPVDGNTVVYVGRVSRRKRVHLLVEVMAALRDTPLRLEVVGPLLTRDDHAYVQEVTGLIHDRGLDDTVRLVGPLPQRETPALYRDAFLHLNLSETGSMDKSVLEALACGCPALTSNPAFGSLLADFPELVVHDDRPAAVAEQVAQVHERRRCYERVALRALVEGTHDVDAYADRIVERLGAL